jgi:hypothetical protein
MDGSNELTASLATVIASALSVALALFAVWHARRAPPLATEGDIKRIGRTLFEEERDNALVEDDSANEEKAYAVAHDEKDWRRGPNIADDLNGYAGNESNLTATPWWAGATALARGSVDVERAPLLGHPHTRAMVGHAVA